MPSIYKAFASKAPAMVDFFRAQGAILTSVSQSSYGMVGGWFVFLLDMLALPIVLCSHDSRSPVG